MPLVDVLDDTFVRCGRGLVRERTGACWDGWLPGLVLHPVEDRGDAGVRWRARAAGGGTGAGLTGTAEVWLEPVPAGTVVHLYVRLDPAPGTRGVRAGWRTRRVPDRLRRTWKRGLHRSKDLMEGEWPG